MIETGLAAVSLVSLLATFAIGSHWPLVGDSVLMHYVVWLTGHGFAPYRDVAEMNLPLTYISEQAAMTVFGAGAAGWRLYDGFLVLAAVACSWHMLRSRGSAAGLFAGALFATVHLQDGIHMAGQRDLLVTVLQVAAGCALLGGGFCDASTSPETRPQLRQFGIAGLFGALSTAAACIKPPAILFPIAVLVWLCVSGRKGVAARRSVAVVAAAILGGCVPVLLCAAYLHHFGATGAFLHDLSGLIAYHASLERRSIGFLLGHMWSPVLPFLLLAALAACTRARIWWMPTDTLFALGAAAGLVSYAIQGKGFPYQRYPFLLWVSLLCGSRLWAVLQDLDIAPNQGSQSTVRPRLSVTATLAALGCAIVLMAVFLMRSSHFSHADPYADLRHDLVARGATPFDRRVQCLDTAGPCIGAMYEARLTQTTGFLYDCYLLDGSKPVVQQQRALLQQEWTERPPQIVVLTDSNCFTGARTFDKYTGWPWMQNTLAEYDVLLERHPVQPLRLWSRPEQPYAYRILQRRGARMPQ
ncbi:hypothetical protein [Terriglobus aquaticus]|uniref:Glycosyltransferase RgtA/B/C/D-like domain-containing protein n=1 Tax=Terriglobus aquaticus TaxID=940139 RepID=A0ABW9KFC3_9BACT